MMHANQNPDTGHYMPLTEATFTLGQRVAHLSGDESACMSARHSVSTPSWLGLARKLAAMLRYSAGSTAMSAPSTMQARHSSTVVRSLTGGTAMESAARQA